MLLAYSRNHSTCLLWNSTFRSLSRFNSADPYSTCWRVKDTVAVQRITTELSLGRMNVMVLPSITRVQLRIFPGSLACHKPFQNFQTGNFLRERRSRAHSKNSNHTRQKSGILHYAVNCMNLWVSSSVCNYKLSSETLPKHVLLWKHRSSLTLF